MIEKFTFDLQAEMPGRPKVKKKLIVVKADGETREHVVMKLIAYLIYYDDRLIIEKSVDMHYKPDLVIPGDHGLPELWIDCGQIAVRKVESLAGKLRSSRFIILKETKREMEQFKKVIENKVQHFKSVEFLGFEPGFISGVALALDRKNEITLYQVMENVIGIALNDQVFESTLYH